MTVAQKTAPRRRRPPAGQHRRATAGEADNCVRERILLKTREKFATLGFAKTSMDEIAGEVGMSKKTLYKFFPAKAALAEAWLEHLFAEMNRRCDAILADALPAVEKLALLVQMLAEHQQRFVTRTTLESLHHHLPHLWRRVEAFRSQRMRRNLQAVIDQGIKEGTVHKSFNHEMFFHFLLGAIQEGINPEVLIHASYSVSEALLGLVGIFMNGVLTDSGRRQYQKLMAATRLGLLAGNDARVG